MSNHLRPSEEGITTPNIASNSLAFKARRPDKSLVQRVTVIKAQNSLKDRGYTHAIVVDVNRDAKGFKNFQDFQDHIAREQMLAHREPDVPEQQTTTYLFPYNIYKVHKDEGKYEVKEDFTRRDALFDMIRDFVYQKDRYHFDEFTDNLSQSKAQIVQQQQVLAS